MENREELYRTVDESIRLELNMADLYQQFALWFPEDNPFWMTLAMEEKNHAAMLRSGKEGFLDQGIFPEDLLAPLPNLQKVNQKISEFIQQGKLRKPSREQVFSTAYRLELSAGEYHVQLFANKAFHTDMEMVFKQLIGDDKDHAERILKYMEQQGIKLRGGGNFGK